MAENIETRISSEQAKEAIYQAHLSKDAIAKIEGLQSSASEINSTVSKIDNKVDFTLASVNLFNPIDTNVVIGSFVNSATGALNVNATYNVTGFIEVKPNTVYTMSYKHQIAWFDSNKVYITGSNSTDTNMTQTSPSNAKYLRCSVIPASWAIFQIEEGGSQSAYMAYAITKIVDYKIGKNRVDLDALSFIKIGKNKFNKNNITSGYYMSTYGTKTSHATYGYSEFIPVNPGEIYTISKYLRFVTFYNNQKSPMPGVSIGESILSPNDGANFTIPLGAFYMIVTFRLVNINIQQIELGTVLTNYSDYCYVYKDIPIKESDAVDIAEYSATSPKQYICSGKETNFYIENIVKNFKKYSGQADLELAIAPTRFKNTSVQTKIIDSTGLVTPFNGTLKVTDDNFSTLHQKTITFKAVDMTKTNAVTIANIGDSYTGRMAWANTILAETIPKTNLTFVGIRRANGSTIDCDGQGGWSITSFFTVNGGGAFSQFMHPVNGLYKYYGPTSFWIDANSAIPSYNAGYFNTTKLLFNPTTGLKITPTTNDIMYNGTNYINWNGTAWVTILEATFGGFTFNYAKYRQAWNIPVVNILNVLLGTNDFAGTTTLTFNTDYSAYKVRYDALIASVKADLPNCKIVIGMPVSSGKQGEYGTIASERKKLGYWMLANQLVKDYANREAENIYLIDYHSQVDRVYGFGNEQIKPFDSYDDTFRDDDHLYKADNVHLSLDGYEQMGLAYMAMIQELR